MLGVFESVDDATKAISEIIGAGIVPAALEMMDQGILVAVEEAFHFGFPLDAEAVLLIEVDGLEAGLDAQRDQIVELCHEVRRPRSAAGQRRSGAAAALEVPQAGLRRGRPAEPQLLHARRRRAAHEAAAHPAADHRDRRASTTCGSSTCFTPATATFIRSCCSTSATRSRSSACWRPATRSSTSASPAAAASPASTASASKRSASCASCSPTTTWPRWTGCATRSTPTDRLSPGKMLPTAGACGMEQTHPGRRAAL